MMARRVIGLMTVTLLAYFVSLQGLARSTNWFQANAVQIRRLDPRFDQLVPKNAVAEKLADGFDWVEGPVWDRRNNYLLFSDIPNNSIFKWQDGGGISLFLKPSGYSGKSPFEGKEPG